jgi:hypothetical protein
MVGALEEGGQARHKYRRGILKSNAPALDGEPAPCVATAELAASGRAACGSVSVDSAPCLAGGCRKSEVTPALAVAAPKVPSLRQSPRA